MDEDHSKHPNDESLEESWTSRAPASAGEFTRLLENGRAPDDLGELLALVYSELHRMAQAQGCRFPDNSLQTTEILNAAYLRLTEKGQTTWKNRRFFFYLAARAMRDVVSNHVKKKRRPINGGGLKAVSLESVCELVGESPRFLSPLVDALRQLDKEDRWNATIVELRFFYGLRREEVAERLNVSPRTVDRRWRLSKARLQELMAN